MKNIDRKSSNLIINKDIIAAARKISKLAAQAISGYLPAVNAVIASGCKDKCRIEKLLDFMLDFCWDKQMLELYKRLCRYYYKIDPHAAAGYVLAYRDMWDNGSAQQGAGRISRDDREKKVRE